MSGALRVLIDPEIRFCQNGRSELERHSTNQYDRSKAIIRATQNWILP